MPICRLSQAVIRNGIGVDVVARMVAVIVSVVGAVELKISIRRSGGSQCGNCSLGRGSSSHHHVVSRAAVLEAVEADQLVAVVDVKEVDVGPGQAAAVAVELRRRVMRSRCRSNIAVDLLDQSNASESRKYSL